MSKNQGEAKDSRIILPCTTPKLEETLNRALVMSLFGTNRSWLKRFTIAPPEVFRKCDKGAASVELGIIECILRAHACATIIKR